MPDGSGHDLPFSGDELTSLELLLGEALPDSRSIKTHASQAGLPAGLVDFEGPAADQWNEVVRKCQEYGCLRKLVESVQARLNRTEYGKRLRRLLEPIYRRGIPFEVRLKGDLDGVRDALGVLLELSDPMEAATKLREIRSALTTLLSQLDEEKSWATVIVGVTREEALNIREEMVRASLEMIAAIDKLLGITRLRDSPRISGPLLRDSDNEEVRAMRYLDAVLDARTLLVLRGRRLLQLAAELLLTGIGRVDAASPTAGTSTAPTSGPATE